MRYDQGVGDAVWREIDGIQVLVKLGQWDETRHPRVAQGEGGGEFTSGGGGGVGAAVQAVAKPTAAPAAPATPSVPASGHAPTRAGQWREAGGLHVMVPHGHTVDSAVAAGQPTHAAAAPPDTHAAHDLAHMRSGVAGSPKDAAKVLATIPLKGRKQGSGTVDDPIDVGDDLDAAVVHLAAGRHIRLNQPKQVSTLLDKLSAFVDAAQKRGEAKPTIDLCNVSVPGTNLFCHDNKGIPRAEMPQLGGFPVAGSPADKLPRTKEGGVDITKQFIGALEAKGVKITDKTVPASYLRATQNQLDGPKVAGISRAMAAGKIPDDAIFVTRDNYVIDGHHRWAAKVALDVADNKIGDVQQPVHMLDMDIGAAIDYTNAFAKAMGIMQVGIGAAVDPRKKSLALLKYFLSGVEVIVHKYADDQPRDDYGRWTTGGGGGGRPILLEPPPTTEVGVDPNAPLPWDISAPAPARYPGDDSKFVPALKDAHGDYVLGRRLQGDALHVEEPGGVGPDAVGMHIFIPQCRSEDTARYEAMIAAHCDHAQLHPGEIGRIVNGNLLKRVGTNYYVRGNYRDLSTLSQELGPVLVHDFGSNYTEVKMMANATPGGTPIPGGNALRHMRVIIPFAEGTPKNTVGEPAVNAATRDQIMRVMSGDTGRIVVQHLDFNGLHLAADADDETLTKIEPQVRALGGQADETVHGPGGHGHGHDVHTEGASRFVTSHLNIEKYPIKDLKSGMFDPVVHEHALQASLAAVNERAPDWQKLTDYTIAKLNTDNVGPLPADLTPTHSEYGVHHIPGITSVEAGEAYLREHWPNKATAVNLQGVAPELVSGVVDGLMTEADRYPNTARRITALDATDLSLLGPEYRTAIAITTSGATTSQIRLNLNAYGNAETFRTQLAESYRNGFLSRPDEAGVVAHEFGHALAYNLHFGGSDPSKMTYQAAVLGKPISEYAKYDAHEWLAETFAGAESGSDNQQAVVLRQWLTEQPASVKAFDPDQARDERGRFSPLDSWSGLQEWADSPDPVARLHDMHANGRLPSVLSRLDATPQDAIWHPEGNVYNHTALSVDQRQKIDRREGIEGHDHRVGMITTLLHDVGKPDTTSVENGRVRAHKHATVGAALARAYLQRVGAPDDVVDRVGNVIQHHMFHTNAAASPKTVTKLQNHLGPATLHEWARQVEADTSGRHPRPPSNPAQEWLDIHNSTLKGVFLPDHKYSPDQERDESGRFSGGDGDIPAVPGQVHPNPHMKLMSMGKRRGGGYRWVEQGMHLPGALTEVDTKEIIAVRKANAQLTPTSKLYEGDPKRQALRDEIRDELYVDSAKTHVDGRLVAHPIQQRRQLWLVMGPPAAGKSSVLAEPLARDNGARLIDYDDAKKALPEFRNGLGAAQVHEESSEIGKDVIKQAIHAGDNIVIPVVGKTLGTYAHDGVPGEGLRGDIEEYTQNGYTVHVALLDLHETQAKQRAVARFYKVGRFVDPAYVQLVDDKPSQNYDIVRSEGRAADYMAYSNDVKHGEPTKFLGHRSGKGSQAIKAAQAKSRSGTVSASFSWGWFS